jgi:phage terminase large subunit GpA-like protein
MMTGEQIVAELGNFDGAAEILQAWRDGMAPEPALLVSDWADKHRMLGSRGSAEPGPWRTARTPYLRDVMDALSPAHPARRVVFMKGAQVGGTECGNNWIGYVIHHAPGPMLAVQPTTELAKRFSDQRIDPLVEETPAIRQRVAPARSRDSGNRQLSKEFPGGQLVMTGANSAVGLRSMSARFLFLDEVDAYPGDVEGEGDPVALAEARARTFGCAMSPGSPRY